MQELLSTADIVLTSPGLTTALELGATFADDVFLPAQSVSQVLLSRMLGDLCPRGCVVTWPDSAFDTGGFDAAGSQGRLRRRGFIYDSIQSLADRADGYEVMRAGISRAVRASCGHGSSRLLLGTTGSRGAAQVAEVIEQLIPEPGRRQG